MKLIFLHGLPAVGKLTIARELAALTGFRLFHNHLTVDLLLSIFDFGSEPFIRLREEIWLSVFRAAAQQNRSLIFTFCPERTVQSRFIQDTIEAIETFSGDVIFVELTCSKQELEGRMVSPSRLNSGKINSLTQYQELSAQGVFEYPAIVGRTFDTTNFSPVETAQFIQEIL